MDVFPHRKCGKKSVDKYSRINTSCSFILAILLAFWHLKKSFPGLLSSSLSVLSVYQFHQQFINLEISKYTASICSIYCFSSCSAIVKFKAVVTLYLNFISVNQTTTMKSIIFQNPLFVMSGFIQTNSNFLWARGWREGKKEQEWNREGQKDMQHRRGGEMFFFLPLQGEEVQHVHSTRDLVFII